MQKNSIQSGGDPRIVVLGGGTGVSNILRGLRIFDINPTAIVTMFDSGGSSGKLRSQFGYPPFGDLRQCLLALADADEVTQIIAKTFDFRFGEDTDLQGHSVGNLVFAALTSLNNGLETAIEEISQLLKVKGTVVPVTLETSDLCAELTDGRIIKGESNIDLRQESNPGIKRVFLTPNVEANPRAVEAIQDADVIVLGPGDLYTSVLPTLLPHGIKDAFVKSKARVLYISNLMTKHGETDAYKVWDFVDNVNAYLPESQVDLLIVNNQMPTEKVLNAYEQEGATFVHADPSELIKRGHMVYATPLVDRDVIPMHHNPFLTGQAILRAAKVNLAKPEKVGVCETNSVNLRIDAMPA